MHRIDAQLLPQVRDGLRVSPGVLGLILLSVAAGSTIATPLSGLVITRLGEARTVTVMSLVCAAGLATAGQFLLGLLHRLPLTGMMVLAGGVVLGLLVVTLDADTLENLRQKLSL